MRVLPGPSSPPPRQRQRHATDRVLPAEGCDLPVPKWPSGHRPSKAEAVAWKRLWSLPQAAAWHELACAETVETYCRANVAAAADMAKGEAKAALLAVVRGLAADLGLTPQSLARLRWRIEPTEEAPALQPVRRQRPRAVDPLPRIGD